MAFAAPVTPAKNVNFLTAIPQFPENPKALILQQCKTVRDLNQIHAHLIKTRLLFNPSIAENLLESAALIVPNAMQYAASIFNEIDRPDTSAYNVMIRGFTLNQSPLEAVLLYPEMLERSVPPDEFTFPCILKACSRLGAVDEGEQIHAQILKMGILLTGFVGNTLIHMYANCGKIKIAGKVFDGLTERNVMAWNSMFAGYSKGGHWEQIVKLFMRMQESGVGFDEVTLISVLTACGRLADLELGKWIADYIEVNGMQKNSTLITCVIDMYAKCGCLDVARRMFDRMGPKDVVAWSAMISGYTQARECKEALDVFHDMQAANVEPNEITLVSVLSSCAVLGALETGKWVHFFIKKRRLKLTVPLGTALVDFYAKCGSIVTAIDVFRQMPVKNVYSWTVLIQGLANNGQGKRALEFFNMMQDKNVPPNDVTFIAVLSACSHVGLVDEARCLFTSMSRDFDIEPRMEHYGCMVDILGRAGLIDEAYQSIQNMPIEPSAVIWRTLLASCRVHKNVELGEESLKHLVKLEPMHSGDYILLSNLYASVGRLEDAMTVRSRMKKRGIRKTPGCSLIEVDGVIHEFLSEDEMHTHSKEIYRATKDMLGEIKSAGYVPNTVEARFDAEEEDKEISVSHHSEKLAIAFALIRTPPGTTIRITKNLRVCLDCHNATKIVTKVFNREIIVRDRNRFHHFRDGQCSCNGYW